MGPPSFCMISGKSKMGEIRKTFDGIRRIKVGTSGCTCFGAVRMCAGSSITAEPYRETCYQTCLMNSTRSCVKWWRRCSLSSPLHGRPTLRQSCFTSDVICACFRFLRVFRNQRMDPETPIFCTPLDTGSFASPCIPAPPAPRPPRKIWGSQGLCADS